MKKIIINSEVYLKRNYKYIILITLLTILFILNVEKQGRLNEYQLNKNITGTYISGEAEAITKDVEYFVFSDNSYCRYKQFNILQEGEYEKAHDNIYVLNNELKEYIVHSNNEIYYFNLKQNDIYIYHKISDHLLYINVTNTEKQEL